MGAKQNLDASSRPPSNHWPPPPSSPLLFLPLPAGMRLAGRWACGTSQARPSECRVRGCQSGRARPPAAPITAYGDAGTRGCVCVMPPRVPPCSASAGWRRATHHTHTPRRPLPLVAAPPPAAGSPAGCAVPMPGRVHDARTLVRLGERRGVTVCSLALQYPRVHDSRSHQCMCSVQAMPTRVAMMLGRSHSLV